MLPAWWTTIGPPWSGAWPGDFQRSRNGRAHDPYPAREADARGNGSDPAPRALLASWRSEPPAPVFGLRAFRCLGRSRKVSAAAETMRAGDLQGLRAGPGARTARRHPTDSSTDLPLVSIWSILFAVGHGRAPSVHGNKRHRANRLDWSCMLAWVWGPSRSLPVDRAALPAFPPNSNAAPNEHRAPLPSRNPLDAQPLANRSDAGIEPRRRPARRAQTAFAPCASLSLYNAAPNMTESAPGLAGENPPRSSPASLRHRGGAPAHAAPTWRHSRPAYGRASRQ
eukprot:358619-Chlamydomonas_euryale.AAC.3